MSEAFDEIERTIETATGRTLVLSAKDPRGRSIEVSEPRNDWPNAPDTEERMRFTVADAKGRRSTILVTCGQAAAIAQFVLDNLAPLEHGDSNANLSVLPEEPR